MAAGTFVDINTFLRNGDWISWTVAIALSVVLTWVARSLLHMIDRRLRPLTQSSRRIWEYLLVDSIAGTRAWVIFLWIFAAFLTFLDGAGHTTTTAHWVLAVATCYQFAVWGVRAIDNWRTLSIERRVGPDDTSAGALTLIATVLKGLFLVIVVLVGLSNMGVNVAAVIASLGVGGIAVALAAQNILGDLLASVSILLDKPFVVGDYIVVGDKQGTVEIIGIKTTRLRSLSGEQVIFSNKDLLESRIQNYKRMWQRRVALKFTARYHGTPLDKIEEIPKWIAGFIAAEPKLKLDRCHLASYSASSLDYELVFYVLDPDYNLYMDLQQKLFMNVLRKFKSEGLEFALPAHIAYYEPVSPSTQTPSPRPLSPGV